jgi:hypothetical protein
LFTQSLQRTIEPLRVCDSDCSMEAGTSRKSVRLTSLLVREEQRVVRLSTASAQPHADLNRVFEAEGAEYRLYESLFRLSFVRYIEPFALAIPEKPKLLQQG